MKPMWKGPLAKSRCLVPARGWYEWKQVERADPATGEIVMAKQPHFFHLPDDQLFAFAGMMAMWKPANDDEWQASCAILTRNAIGPAAEVHERMPCAEGERLRPGEVKSQWCVFTCTSSRANPDNDTEADSGAGRIPGADDQWRFVEHQVRVVSAGKPAEAGTLRKD
jgi:hypothetical protein